MDSITQGILGAAASQSALGRKLPRKAGLIGAVGGVIPDLDIFIQSANDPTIGWLFHRHFTHSLLFIPIGGLIAAMPFLFLKEFKGHQRWVILAGIIGYATHAPLDMFTSYGTQLFWPFSNYRVALDWMGIVDPIYTITLLAGIIFSARTRNPRPARVALLISSLYICFGGWQHYRATLMQNQLLSMRDQHAQHTRVMPAPGWLMYWRSTYIADGKLYADGIRTPWLSSPLVLEGKSADAVTIDDLPQRARSNAETRRQFEIFYWFADGLISPIGDDPNAIGDMRITTAVESLDPLWGLEFDPRTGTVRRWVPSAIGGRNFGSFVRELFRPDPRYKPLPDIRAANQMPSFHHLCARLRR